MADPLKKKTDGLLDVDLGYSLLPKSISCILPQSPPCVCVCLPSPCIFHLHISSAYILFLYASLLRMYTLCVSFVGMTFLSVPYQCVSIPLRGMGHLSVCITSPSISIPSPYESSLCVYHARPISIPCPYGFSLCMYHAPLYIYPLSERVLSMCVSHFREYLPPVRMGPLFAGIPSRCLSRLLPPFLRVSFVHAYCDGMEARARSVGDI